ncbi:hypothetical protein COV12_00215 [Candidatus Woesearchaeota archaeon CG10_big_fil_rev_8_21_14_0_10_32_24]|nr:MAG: hypothetical protein COV12_00215 [Candidatus Woesearchaeota archaeon CG10_big_fil_rev_8_21_14_0_10_32_24]
MTINSLESKLSGVKVAIATGAVYLSTALAGCMSPVLPQARTEVNMEYNGPTPEEVKARTDGKMDYVVIDGKEVPQAESYFADSGRKIYLLGNVMNHNDRCVSEYPKLKQFWNVYRTDVVSAMQGSGTIVLNLDDALQIGIDGKGKRWERSDRKMVRASEEYLQDGILNRSEAIPNFCNTDTPELLYSFPTIAGTKALTYDDLQQNLDLLHGKDQGGQ